MRPFLWASSLTIVYYYFAHEAMFFGYIDPVPFIRDTLGRNFVLSIYTISMFTHGVSALWTLCGFLGLRFLFFTASFGALFAGIAVRSAVQQIPAELVDMMQTWMVPVWSVETMIVWTWKIASNAVKYWKVMPNLPSGFNVLCNCFFVFCVVLQAMGFVQRCFCKSLPTATHCRMRGE